MDHNVPTRMGSFKTELIFRYLSRPTELVNVVLGYMN